jgi:SAM-dependent methyltransferase
VSSNSPTGKASALVTEHLDEIRLAAARGPVIDLACGRGRHALYLARSGIPALGLDRNRDHLRELEVSARPLATKPTPVRCDLETGRGIPVQSGACGAILVFRFLFRPLAPAIEEALCPGGILLYETFSLAERESGRGPRRKEFFLEPDELPALFPKLHVISYREGPDDGTPPTFTARLLARKPD